MWGVGFAEDTTKKIVYVWPFVSNLKSPDPQLGQERSTQFNDPQSIFTHDSRARPSLEALINSVASCSVKDFGDRYNCFIESWI